MSMKKELWLLHLFFFGGTIFTIDGRLIRGSNADRTPASSVLTRVSQRTAAFFQQGSAFWFYRKMVPLGVVSAPFTRSWTSMHFPNAFPWRASWVLPTSRSLWVHWDSVPGAPRSYTRLGDGKAAVAADACESSLRMLPSRHPRRAQVQR